MLNYYLILIVLASIIPISMPYHIRLTRVPIRSLSSSISSSSIIRGDSLDQNTYKKLFKSGELADILFTDPPYCKLNNLIYDILLLFASVFMHVGLLERRRKGGDLRDPKKYKKKLDDDPTTTRFESVKEFTKFTKEWLDQALKYVKPTGKLIIWTNALGKQPTMKLCEGHGYQFMGEFIWAKRTTLITEQEAVTSTKNEVLLRIYETALVFQPKTNLTSIQSNDDPAIPWSVCTGYHDTASDKSQIQVHRHPCHKPYEALEPLLRTWTRPDDLILDPFAGSGGIPQAALRLGRRVKGVEIVPTWAEYAQNVLVQTGDTK